MIRLNFILWICILFQASQCAQWTYDSLQDGAILTTCSGDTLNLLWKFSTGSSETVTSVEWLYKGHSEEMIATQVHGIFIPLPTFSRRASFAANGGIALTNLIIGDAGNYSIVVSGHDSSGRSFSLQRFAQVEVGDGVMTDNHQMHVTTNPQAVLDPVTGKLCIELQCGHFTYLATPPIQVEWVSPMGQILPSSRYSDGYFRLLLNSTEAKSTFTCRIPQAYSSTACLRGDGQGQNATFTIDAVEARFLLLEAENAQLKKDLEVVHKELETKERNDTDFLQQHVEHLEDAAQKSRTMFHAVKSVDNYDDHQAIGNVSFPAVYINEGGGYDPISSVFTAPVAGYYAFLVTFYPLGEAFGNVTLIANGKKAGIVQIDSLKRNYSGHALVHIDQGQKVLVSKYVLKFSPNGLYLYLTDLLEATFSGFMLKADPLNLHYDV